MPINNPQNWNFCNSQIPHTDYHVSSVPGSRFFAGLDCVAVIYSRERAMSAPVTANSIAAHTNWKIPTPKFHLERDFDVYCMLAPAFTMVAAISERISVLNDCAVLSDVLPTRCNTTTRGERLASKIQRVDTQWFRENINTPQNSALSLRARCHRTRWAPLGCGATAVGPQIVQASQILGSDNHTCTPIAMRRKLNAQ